MDTHYKKRDAWYTLLDIVTGVAVFSTFLNIGRAFYSGVNYETPKASKVYYVKSDSTTLSKLPDTQYDSLNVDGVTYYLGRFKAESPTRTDTIDGILKYQK
jgi:hypothetical protein